MTSLATIAGALPLAMGVGPGAETRAPLARGIIGGIILSTLVTLIFVPLLYVLLDRFGGWVARLTRREDKAEPQRAQGTQEEGHKSPPKGLVGLPAAQPS
jgi:HAE1 family hydrophobic/amphiphilic exporter-1